MNKTGLSPPDTMNTKPSDNPGGLAGAMPGPIKITMLGAGSSFTPRLLNDVLRIPGEQGGVIVVVSDDTF